MIISNHITTLLNYRTTVPAGSDFSRSAKFPEVYHGYRISKAAFSGVIGRARGRGVAQHIASFSADNTATYCVSSSPRVVVWKEDPELTFFGSTRKKREVRIGWTYPYARHLHRCGIRISITSAYVDPIHMRYICLYLAYVHTRCKKIISDMCHISTQTRERTL